MKKSSILWVVGLIIVVVVIILASSQKPTETGPIKIGMITPISGNVAALGELMKRATDIAVQEVNDAGGVNGRPISIIYEDDQCTPAKSVSAAQKLVGVDKVKIIIGTSCSGSVLSILPVTSENKVFLISGSATTPELSNKSPLFARTIADDSAEGLALAQAAVSHGWKKVAVLQETSDYALGLYGSFSKNFTEASSSIVREEYPTATTDFRSLLTKLRATNPDALLIIPQSTATAQRILTNLTQLKWNITLLVGHIISGGADLVMANKTVLEGAMAAEQSPDLNNPKYLALEEKYNKLYGVSMDYKAYAEAQYDLVYILRDGLKNFGNDPEKIAAWVRTIKDYDGASGRLSIGQDGNRVGGHTLKVIKNGVAVPVGGN